MPTGVFVVYLEELEAFVAEAGLTLLVKYLPSTNESA